MSGAELPGMMCMTASHPFPEPATIGSQRQSPPSAFATVRPHHLELWRQQRVDLEAPLRGGPDTPRYGFKPRHGFKMRDQGKRQGVRCGALQHARCFPRQSSAVGVDGHGREQRGCERRDQTGLDEELGDGCRVLHSFHANLPRISFQFRDNALGLAGRRDEPAARFRYLPLMAIRLTLWRASSDFGSVTVRTPFLKLLRPCRAERHPVESGVRTRRSSAR